MKLRFFLLKYYLRKKRTTKNIHRSTTNFCHMGGHHIRTTKFWKTHLFFFSLKTPFVLHPPVLHRKPSSILLFNSRMAKALILTSHLCSTGSSVLVTELPCWDLSFPLWHRVLHVPLWAPSILCFTFPTWRHSNQPQGWCGFFIFLFKWCI